MKTIAIDVCDLLTALSPDEVGRRLGEVPGVESVSVDRGAKRHGRVRRDPPTGSRHQVAGTAARSRRRRIACRLDRHGPRRPRHGRRITGTGVWSFRTPGP